MSRAPVIAVAAVVAAAVGFGAAALTRGSTAAATGQLSEAKVASARFDPPAVGTTSVPALRVVVHHRAKKKPVKPTTPIVQVDPRPATPTPAPYTPPTSPTPRTNPGTKPKSSGPTDTIGPTEGGGN